MAIFAFALILFSSMIAGSIVQSQPATVDMEAAPIFRAQQAIAIAKAQGYNVQVTEEELAASIVEFEQWHSDTFAGQSEAIISAGQADAAGAQSAKRYKCSYDNFGSFTGVTINWWAYANVSNGVIIGNPYSTGFNYSTYGIPGTRVEISGSVTAYKKDSGRKIVLDMSGTASISYLEIHISTQSVDLSCTQSA